MTRLGAPTSLIMFDGIRARAFSYCASALLFWCCGGFETGNKGATSTTASRPDLGVAIEPITEEPILTPQKIGIRNLGVESGIADVYLILVNARGEVIPNTQVKYTVSIPPANHGGEHGVTVPLTQPTALSTAAEKLLSTGASFGMSIRIKTLGGDLDYKDNSATRIFGGRTGPLLGEEQSALLLPAVSRHTQWSTTDDVNTFGMILELPTASSKQLVGRSTPFNQRDFNYLESLSLRASDNRLYSYPSDTTPPQIKSLRIVFFDDGTVGLHLAAIDDQSGIALSGVRVLYKADSPGKWHEKILASITDDFGRPTLFEGYLGLYGKATRMRVKLFAFDRSGNSTHLLPREIIGIQAPPGAQRLIRNSAVKSVLGDLLLLPELAEQRLLEYSDLEGRRTFQLSGEEHTESHIRTGMNRFEDLRMLHEAFRTENIDVHAYRRAGVKQLQITSKVGEALTELVLWP